jgi:endogenous inhibitor of DNA gyrase (YacG/DUF329 family)
MNQYPLPDGGPEGGELVHVDAYRLAGAGDLDSIGWDRVTDPAFAGIVVVEWPERLEGAPPWNTEPVRVTIRQSGEEERDVAIDLPESWRGRAGVKLLKPREATVCPVTGSPVAADSPTWPFADERARMADLYRWMSGKYSVEAREQDPT